MSPRSERMRRPRRGAQSGATAVEFAMVAGPLFLIMMATLELAMVFVVSTMLESALGRASREIRTGQHQAAAEGQSADVSEGAFVGKVCGAMVFLQGHCADHFFVDVRTGTDFSGAGAPDPVSDGEFSDSDLTFEPGGQSQIVVVRGYYHWPLFTPFLSQALAKLDGNTALIVSADTFRNEPFAAPSA